MARRFEDLEVWKEGIARFHSSERERAAEPHRGGPLQRFFSEISKLQQKDLARQESNPSYQPRLRVTIVTARTAPAHTRVITTLRDWGIQVDEALLPKRRGEAGDPPHAPASHLLR